FEKWPLVKGRRDDGEGQAWLLELLVIVAGQLELPGAVLMHDAEANAEQFAQTLPPEILPVCSKLFQAANRGGQVLSRFGQLLAQRFKHPAELIQSRLLFGLDHEHTPGVVRPCAGWGSG